MSIKEQRKINLINFMARFELILKDNMDKGIIEEGKEYKSFNSTTLYNHFYLNFSKHVWPDGFTEYHIECYDKNIFDRNICPTKKSMKGTLHEHAFIYVKGKNLIMSGRETGKDSGTIIRDWNVEYRSNKF